MADSTVYTCDVCGREIKGNWGFQSHLRMHERKGETAAVPDSEEEPLFDAAPFSDISGEPAPARPKRRLWSRGEKPLDETTPRTPKEAKPRTPSKRRVDASDLFERVWFSAGRRVEKGNLPLGRCLQLQSGATGVILDDAIKGTVVDKPVQWVVRGEERLSKVAAVLAAPTLVIMIERNPAAAETLAPFLVDALMAMGPAMIRSLKKAEKKQADFSEAMRGLGPALGLSPDEEVTPQALLQWMFPPVEPEPMPRAAHVA